jgi:hypothetical protein
MFLAAGYTLDEDEIWRKEGSDFVVPDAEIEDHHKKIVARLAKTETRLAAGKVLYWLKGGKAPTPPWDRKS